MRVSAATRMTTERCMMVSLHGSSFPVDPAVPRAVRRNGDQCFAVLNGGHDRSWSWQRRARLKERAGLTRSADKPTNPHVVNRHLELHGTAENPDRVVDSASGMSSPGLQRRRTEIAPYLLEPAE